MLKLNSNIKTREDRGVDRLKNNVYVLFYPPQSKGTYNLMLEKHYPSLR